MFELAAVRPYRSAVRTDLLWTVAALLAVGVVMVYSASAPMADRRLAWPTYFLERQLLYIMAGSFALVFASAFDYRLYRRWSRPILYTTFALLILVLVPGVGAKINGARRWFNLGFVNFQPSEMAKLALILVMADHLSRPEATEGVFRREALPRMLLIAAPAALVAIEPDIGTAALIVATLLGMWLVSGRSIRYVLAAGVLAAPAAAAVLWLKFEHVRRRLDAFLDPGLDPLGANYQTIQAAIAQGSGGLFGRGLGCSQAKLLFLPEAHNDFILAIIGEELGLIGSLAVLLLFALLIYLGIKAARQAPDLHGALVAFGITLLIALQALINVAVVTRTIPNKGMSLPFISFGGSALVFFMAGVGVLLNVASAGAREGIEDPVRVGATPIRTGPAGRLASPVQRACARLVGEATAAVSGRFGGRSAEQVGGGAGV
ncbi:MAG: putative lipid II flippase FtsW [Planctomycetota bacterium]|nr:putative lipid II flippase FtsW [Planctomycetota bacterium]